ncbi:MAG TPA: allophanate hydrolase, partial [Burkholderiales bacterium]|nr:allophanate hydrolase [Burkholderiales bacterium]
MPLSYSLDLTRLADAYESGALTPTAVVEYVLAQIKASRDANPAWIHVIPREALLWRAAELERRHARGETLPLYGVPFAVKDNIDVAGHPTSAACPAYAYLASKSAHVVQRLEQAGALCIGKTNMDQFATGLVGTRSPHGACKNPFDSRYISGGSSSGSAVAVSLGQVSFALGTDTAGSGRVPAGYCNVVGLKPSRGLISMTGVVPACRSVDCISIFALTAEDAVAVLDVAAGYDDADPYSRADTPPPVAHTAGHIRCGVPRASQLQFFGDDVAKRAFERALKTLASLGAELVEIDYKPFAETATLLYEGPWVAERLAAIKPFFEKSPDALHPVTRKIIGAGARFDAVDV